MFFSSFPPETTRRLLSEAGFELLRRRARARCASPRARSPSTGCWPGDELLVRPGALPGDPRSGTGRRLSLRALRRGAGARRPLPPPRHRPLARGGARDGRARGGARGAGHISAHDRVRLLQPRLVRRRRRRSRACASSAMPSGCTPCIRTSTLDERFDPVVSWHNPRPELMSDEIPGAVNAYGERYFSPETYRSDSNQHWRSGCPHEELRAGAFPWLQILVHPAIWVYPGETMGQTMRAMLEADSARRLAQLAEDDIDLALTPLLRVVHCPVNTAGVPWANVQALRRRGVDAKLVVFNRYPLHPEADRSLERRGGFVRRQATQWRALLGLLPTDRRLPLLLRPHARPAARCSSRSCARSARSRSCTTSGPTSEASPRPSSPSAGRPDAQLVGSYDAIRWVPEAEVIPPGIDVASIEPAFPSADSQAAGDPPRALVPPPEGNRARARRVRGPGRRPRPRRGPPPRRGVRALPRGGHRRRPAERRLVRALRDRVHGAREAGRDVPARGGVARRTEHELGTVSRS